MKAFLDTSVLVATFYGDHEHHQPSLDLFLRYGREKACCDAHSLAEVYATLTSMPGGRRVAGDAAMLFLDDIRTHLTVIALAPEEHLTALSEAAAAGIAGDATYDALLGHCACKAEAETIYTWNVKDFRRLPDPIAERVKRPDQSP